MSPKIKDDAFTIGTCWTIDDGCKAHDILDVLAEEDRKAQLERAATAAANE